MGSTHNSLSRETWTPCQIINYVIFQVVDKNAKLVCIHCRKAVEITAKFCSENCKRTYKVRECDASSFPILARSVFCQLCGYVVLSKYFFQIKSSGFYVRQQLHLMQCGICQRCNFNYSSFFEWIRYEETQFFMNIIFIADRKGR